MTNETVKVTAVVKAKNLRTFFTACMGKLDVWMVRGTKWQKLRLESVGTPRSVIFEKVMCVALSEVITLGRLDNKAGQPTKKNKILLEFFFKWFAGNEFIRR